MVDSHHPTSRDYFIRVCLSKAGASLRAAWGLPAPVGWAGEREAPRDGDRSGHNEVAMMPLQPRPRQRRFYIGCDEDAAHDDCRVIWPLYSSDVDTTSRHDISIRRHLDTTSRHDISAPTCTGSTVQVLQQLPGVCSWTSWISHEDFLQHLPHLQQGHKV